MLLEWSVEQMLGDGWMDWIVDAPETVMTNKAPAVLKNGQRKSKKMLK